MDDYIPKILEKIKEKDPTAYQILSSGYIKNNISHAYIFVGQNKDRINEVLDIFSKILLCSSNTGEDSCINCKMHTAKNHPDYKVWKPEEEKSKFIKLEQVHELISATQRSPITAKKKILILEDIQQLRLEGSNSILKTLEEPTPFSIIILIVDSIENVLPTIISRCQTIPIRSSDDETPFYINIKKYIPSSYVHASKLSEELNVFPKEEIKKFFISFEKSLWEDLKNSDLKEKEVNITYRFFEKIEKHILCIDSYVSIKMITEAFFIDLFEFNKRMLVLKK